MQESRVKERFKLELEPNFVDTLGDYFMNETDKSLFENSDFSKELFGKNLLSMIDTEEIMSRLPHEDNELKIRLMQSPLKDGECISLTHSNYDGNSILQAYFNQYNPNGKYRTAWSYIFYGEVENDLHGCLLVEREREEDFDLIEFCFFRQNLTSRAIHHYAHIYTEISEKDRARITISGFNGFREIMEALARQHIKISHNAVDNLLNAVVAPIYDFFQKKT